MKTCDPCELLERLTVAELSRRISELESQRKGLIVLLRAARARERSSRRTPEKDRVGIMAEAVRS